MIAGWVAYRIANHCIRCIKRRSRIRVPEIAAEIVAEANEAVAQIEEVVQVAAENAGGVIERLVVAAGGEELVDKDSYRNDQSSQRPR